MTRAQFLNDLYHRLPGLTQEQAEQHLTYYAEMLNDRMEDGMSEEEAVASMEPLDVIAQRILQDEGLPEAPVQPPQYPRLPETDGSRFTKVPNQPKKLDKKKIGMAVLWVVAIVMAIFSIGRRVAFHRISSDLSTSAAPEPAVDYGVYEEPDSSWEYTEELVLDSLYSLWGIEIGPDGIHGDHFDISPDGIYASNGEQELYIGPDGIELGKLALGDTEDVIGAHYSFEDDTYRVSAEVDSVNINWSSGTVKVRGWEEDYIQFQEFCNVRLKQSQKLEYEVEGTQISISKNSGPDKGLIVWVPVHLLNALTVEASSADVYIDQLATEYGDVHTSSGNIAVTNTAANYLSVRASSGSVALRSVEAGNLEVNTSSGSIWLDALLADSMSVSASSGKVSGYLAGNYADISTTSGKITLNTGVTNGLCLSSSSGTVTANLQDAAPAYVDVDTTSGNVFLNMPEDWGFELEFDSSSGYFDHGPFDVFRGDGWYIAEGHPTTRIEVDTSSGNLQLAAQE